ncbi:phage tail tape measure protein [uncultured Granulicatella sp.]|uniref:phage tail tape measure protein n=1 Tax=uncultured Granulicatella sp. TaxID=316089 RepID=UPI0028D4F9B1|nr:phage tail tape measure protein [uncultured Granulicatella sp.]
MAEKPFGKLVVELGINNAKFDQGLSNAQKQLRTLNKAIKGAGEEIKLYGKGSESVTTKLGLMGQAFKANQAIIDENNKSIAKKREEIEKLQATIAKTGGTKEQHDELAGKLTNIEKYKRNIAEATAEMSKLRREYSLLAKEQAIANNNHIQRGQRLIDSGKETTESANKLLNFSRGWAVAGAAVGASIVGVTKAAIDYEEALAGVKKTTDPTALQFSAFEQGFRKLANTIPVSAKELANMGAMAGQLGIHNESLLSFVETMAKLQTATNIVGEEGAADLAKFMNIMGTSQDKVSNIGSSLVDLGNNFATTEHDILSMAKNLAGVGRVLHLSEGDILGIATALSSVGIEAEKGGTAISTFLTDTAQVVEFADVNERAYKRLVGLSKALGVAPKQFQEMFRNAPLDVLSQFVDKIGQANEEGSEAVKLIGYMGVKQSRLRDTLLRAGGAHKLFNDAISRSNKAFKDNTALQREFQTFSETTASKLAIAKNRLTDVAIEAGNKLLPLLADALKNSGGWIDGIKGMVEWFGKLPPSIQTAVGALTAFGVAGGPLFTIFGYGKLGWGLGKEMFGGFLKKAGEAQVAAQAAKGAFELTETAIEAVGTASIGAGSAVGKLAGGASKASGFFSLLAAVPLSGWLIGIAAAAGIGYLAWKQWGEEGWNAAQKVAKSKENLKQWGVDVGEVVDKSLEKMQQFASESQMYISNAFTVSESSKEKMKTSTHSMFEAMTQAANDKVKDLQAIYDKLPDAAKASAEKELNERKQKAEEAKQVFADVETKINAIYEKASQERRSLTKDEVVEINSLRTQAQQALAKALGSNKGEAEKLFQNMTESIKKMSDEQLRTRIKSLNKMKEEEVNNLNERKKALEDALSNGLIKYSEYHKSVEALENEHKNAMHKIGVQKYKTLKEQRDRAMAHGNDAEADAYDNAMHATAKEFGTTVKAMEAAIELEKELLDRRNKYVSDAMTKFGFELSKNAQEANKAWEKLITDETTGNIVRNIQQVVEKATESEEGWNNLKFIIKEANLTSNAESEIKKALIATGKWDELSFEEKVALVRNDTIGETTDKLITAYGLWNNTEFVEKLAKIDTTAPDAKEKIKALLAEYNVAEKTFANPLNLPTMTDADGTGRVVADMDEKIRQAQERAKQGANFKTETNAESSTKPQVESLIQSINGVPTSKNTTITADASQAYSVIDRLGNALRAVTSQNWIASIGAWFTGHATGTDYHKGGLAFLGDGGRREPFLTPDGMFGVSPATDTLYNLPRGTKVWSSVDKFKRDTLHKPYLANYLGLLPRFANGTIRSFMDDVPNVFASPYAAGVGNVSNVTNNSSYSPTLHIEHFHADKGQNEEELFKKFAWLAKREGDRM